MIDKLTERLKTLSEQRQAAVNLSQQAQTVLQRASAEIVSIDGAIQEVQYWIKQIEGEANEATDSTGNIAENKA